ncbi:hypothetical protein ACFQX9_18335 [Bradyrhizobium sp. GCM10028915]|uniref:hypothetical protein n=1 Tax=Bradyrhizobium sp. GCM10028915 TaxID=3273385 RepID=UPI003615AD0F
MPEDHQRLIALAAAGNRPDDIARALGHGQNRLCEVARISQHPLAIGDAKAEVNRS